MSSGADTEVKKTSQSEDAVVTGEGGDGVRGGEEPLPGGPVVTDVLDDIDVSLVLTGHKGFNCTCR